MGTIKIIGTAQRNVPYDVMNITITFNSWEKTPSAALSHVDEQCEKFLSLLKIDGFDIHKLRMSDTKLSQDRVKDDDDDEENEWIRLEATASIDIKISVKYDMSVLNHIKDILKKENFDADLSIYHYISNILDIHKELLKEAIEDSKAKAEIIASTMGQKLTGIDKVLFGDKYGRIETEEDFFEEHVHALRGSSLSDELSADTQTVKECVEVDWIIE